MKKDAFTGMSLDKDALRLLDAIAEQETEGNRSAAVRKLVREAAKVRGLGPESENWKNGTGGA